MKSNNHMPKAEKTVLNISRPIIAMIHVRALPGTPRYRGNISHIISKAVEEAKVYQQAGIKALVIENMHDIPYLKGKVGPEITAMMGRIGYEVKQATGLPCGIQILAAANREALAVALAADLDFVRAEGFVFGHLADEGIIEAQAGELLRYRKHIGADHIPIFTDIKKKHSSHAITADVDIVETAKAAAYFLSDGLIITGNSTGEQADLAEIKEVKAAVDLPVLVGSGIRPENIGSFLSVADGVIVGSYFKQDGYWANEVNVERVKKLIHRTSTL